MESWKEEQPKVNSNFKTCSGIKSHTPPLPSPPLVICLTHIPDNKFLPHHIYEYVCNVDIIGRYYRKVL